jgi:hypothetical protein
MGGPEENGGGVMITVHDVCRHIRSKNAGPYWVTIDLFFKDDESFRTYVDNAAIAPAAIGKIFGVDAAQVKRFPVESLAVLKISFPRGAPQGGAVERDMHFGQQYVRLLDVALA